MKYYTATEAASAFNVSKVTIIRWIQNGKLKAEKDDSGRGGGEYKIPESEIPKENLDRLKSLIEGKTEIVKEEPLSSQLSNFSLAISQLPKIAETLSQLPEMLETMKRIANSLEKLQNLPSIFTKKTSFKKNLSKKPIKKTSQKKPARKQAKKNKPAKK